MAATPKPIRKDLKKETVRIKKSKENPGEGKIKSKSFNKWAKGMYKADVKSSKIKKGE